MIKGDHKSSLFRFDLGCLIKRTFPEMPFVFNCLLVLISVYFRVSVEQECLWLITAHFTVFSSWKLEQLSGLCFWFNSFNTSATTDLLINDFIKLNWRVMPMKRGVSSSSRNEQVVQKSSKKQKKCWHQSILTKQQERMKSSLKLSGRHVLHLHTLSYSKRRCAGINNSF